MFFISVGFVQILLPLQSILIICVFLEICSLYLSCLICWQEVKLNHNISLSFIPNFANSCRLYSLLVYLAKGLSNVLILSKSTLLVSLFFSFYFSFVNSVLLFTIFLISWLRFYFILCIVSSDWRLCYQFQTFLIFLRCKNLNFLLGIALSALPILWLLHDAFSFFFSPKYLQIYWGFLFMSF